MSMEHSTANRLSGYGNFSPEVIDAVADHAAFQAESHLYDRYLSRMGFSNAGTPSNLPILDSKPEDYDPAEAIGVFLPHGNPLDVNQMFSIATIVGTNPDKRVIVQANPGPFRANANTQGRAARQRMREADFGPAVEPFLAFADAERIERFHLFGPSYGADLAEAAMAADAFKTITATVFEPTSIVRRSLYRQLADFGRAGKRLNEYVDATGLDILKDARSATGGLVGAGIGMAGRSTNRAAAKGMRQGAFAEHVTETMRQNPDTVLTVAWGDESEMARHFLMLALMTGLNRNFGDRVHGLQLRGVGHAGIDDVHLKAAVLLQGIKNSEKPVYGPPTPNTDS